MDSFFDMRELLVAILRRVKEIVLITLLCSVCFALVRFTPSAIQYFTYDDMDKAPVATTLTEEEQPYYYTAGRIIYIHPVYVKNGDAYYIDQSNVFCRAYGQFINDERIVQALLDDFFKEAQVDDYHVKQKMVNNSYRTSEVLNKEYRTNDFINQFSVQSDDHFVRLAFFSGNVDFSERVVDRTEKLLTDLISENVGTFTRESNKVQITSWLPNSEGGLIPKTSIAQKSVRIRPLLSEMINKAARGAVIGLVAGFGLAIILVFLLHIARPPLQTRKALEAWDLSVLAVVPRGKKGLLPFIDNWISCLEGNGAETSSIDESYQILAERLEALYPEDGMSILLTGSMPHEKWNSHSENIQNHVEKIGIEIIPSPCIISSAETVKKSKAVNSVVLIESLSYSAVDDVKHEIEIFKELGHSITGIVLIQ